MGCGGAVEGWGMGTALLLFVFWRWYNSFVSLPVWLVGRDRVGCGQALFFGVPHTTLLMM